MSYRTAKEFGFRVGCITASGIIVFGAVAVTQSPVVVIGGGMLIAFSGVLFAALGANADPEDLRPERQQHQHSPVLPEPPGKNADHSWRMKPR